MKNYIKYFGILAIGLMACEPEFDTPVDELGTYTSGEIDLSNYVAIGNSLTAGFADNALYITGQENSFPNILAEKFSFAGGGEFTQPLMADNAGGLLMGGEQIEDTRLVLYIGEDGTQAPVNYRGSGPTTEITNKLQGPFNNMGVPGAKSFHLAVPGYGNVQGVQSRAANPYFARFASASDASVIGDAVGQDPTFFTLWIGNNDVLGYATSGGDGEDQTGNMDPTSYGSNDITDPQVFAMVYSQLVEALVANDAAGVLINIPGVTAVPYFNTVPVDAIPLDEATAAMLNAQFKDYNELVLPGLAMAEVISGEEMQARQISFSAGQNFVTMVDEDLTDISQIVQGPPFNLDAQTATLIGQLRQATPQDLIPLPSSSVLGTTVGDDPTMINGVSVPLADQHVLTPSEQELVQAATDAYNQTIKSLAEQYGLGYLDSNAFLSQLASGGIPYEGGHLTADFGTGGAFSLDGVHLTPRGNALVADRLIQEIIETYGAELPRVDLGNYATVTPSNDVN